jgi:hypothetical protein
MECQKIEQEIRKLEQEVSIKCYNNQAINNNSNICISLMYQQWFLKIEREKYCKK